MNRTRFDSNASAIVVLGLSLTCAGCWVPQPARHVPLPRLSLADGVTADWRDAPAPRRRLLKLDGRSLFLKELQSEARSRNPVVDEWAARVDAATERGRQTRSAYFPRLHTTGVYLQLENDVAFSDPFGGRIVVQDKSTYTQTTDAEYSVLDWGRAHYLHQAAQQNVRGTEANRRRALEALDVQVARMFYSVFRNREEQKTIDASVRTLEGALTLARNLQRADRATRADVLVVEARLERRRFQSRVLRDRARDWAEELARLLDQPPDTQLQLVEPEGLPAEPGAAAAWEQTALEARAELIALESAHQALRDAARAEEATYFPEVTFFVQHQYSSTDSDFQDPNIFSGGFRGTWDLFSGFRRRARLRELHAEARQIRAEHHAMQTAIQNEVRRAVRHLVRALDGVRVAAVVVGQAEENLRRVTDLFRQGKATGQEVLEAESLLNAERSRAVLSRFEAFLSEADLLFICGGSRPLDVGDEAED